MLQRPNSSSELLCPATNVPPDLLTKLNEAVAAANAAQGELVSRSKAVGLLLLEARKLHPKVADFKAFLGKVNGLKSVSWAYDLMKLAGGRTTEAELRKDAADRQAESRAKKRLAKPEPTPEPTPEPKPKQALLDSGRVIELGADGFRDVTEKPSLPATARQETAEESAERRKAENAELELSAEEKAAKQSAHFLSEFIIACRSHLPKITVEADRQKARLLVSELTMVKTKKAA